ncbi:hypothetical protein J3Q64DRAFT_1705384, partial [Phycomyces blakesleeanus]
MCVYMYIVVFGAVGITLSFFLSFFFLYIYMCVYVCFCAFVLLCLSYFIYCLVMVPASENLLTIDWLPFWLENCWRNKEQIVPLTLEILLRLTSLAINIIPFRCVYVYVFMRLCVYVCVCMYVCMYVCLYACIFYIYI